METVNASESPSPSPSPQPEAHRASVSRMYTWISENGRLIEQVRVVPKGDSTRARGWIVAAAGPDTPAFTVEYEAQLGADTTLRRVWLTLTTEECTRTIDLVCDDEGAWLLEDSSGTRSRVGGDGVVDVDITYSVFFASVMIRRLGLYAQPGSEDVRVLSVDSMTLDVTEDTVTLSSDDEQVYGITATASTSATVDPDGVIIDVPGLSRRA